LPFPPEARAPIDPLLNQLQESIRGTYAVERELGGGGMSRVFLAREIALDRHVVVKVLPDHLLGGVSIDRFRREIQLAAQLQHANIVPVLAAGELHGLPYYTMPFVQGESLRERMRRVGAMPIADVIALLRDVTRALAAAHAHGIAHRDIKPENILISGDAAVVTDFGIAKALAAAKRSVAPDDAVTDDGSTLTQLGTSLGTPAYMSPEQAAGDPSTNHRADIYSLGVVAYEMLAGQPLFETTSAHTLVTSHMTEQPVPIETRRKETPPALAGIVMRCLEKNPDNRPQTATAVLDAIDTAARATSGGIGRGRSLAVYAAAFATAAIVARLAIRGIGLPEWVFSSTVVVMALGLPAVFMLSPRKVLRGGVAALAALVLFVAGYMTLRVLGIGPAGSLFAQGRLHQRDWGRRHRLPCRACRLDVRRDAL
jgi:serine/threonine-protein kinase